MPEGISAQGTLIAVSPDPTWPPSAPVGGGLSFVNIAELRNTTLPPLSRNPLETTTHNEQDDSYIVGIRRRGDLSFQVNFVPGNATHNHHTGLIAKWYNGTRNIYRATTPDGTAWLFSGFVTQVGPQAPVDDILTADVTVRPTGPQTFIDAPLP